MKTLVLFSVLALFLQFTLSSQPCLPDGITFYSQAEIDSFQTNYPNCTEIGGDVIISEGYITNLNGLSVVTSIEGGLRIGVSDNGTSLNNLTGLEGLTYIGGDLFIGSNNALTSLTGLDNLSFINGNFTLGVLGVYFQEGNPLLSNLTGLGSLTSVGGRLSISSNDALVSLNGLDNLETIPDLYITYNSSLASCEAQWLCDYLANPNGSVNIYNNAPGCNNPLEVADSCGITLSCLPFGNYYFFTQSDIDNFQTNYPNCSEIEGDIYISGDTSITDLNGFSFLTSIGRDLVIGKGDLYFGNNPNLNSLTGLNNLTSIGRDFVIGYSGPGPGPGVVNPILANLTGLEGLTSIGGDFNIEFNDSLTNLTGLDNLTSIGGDLTIVYNYYLSSLSGLNNLDSIWGDILIFGNFDLLNLTGLENLTSIEGSLSICGSSAYINSSLTSLTGLESLTSIGEYLKIADNSSLTSLSSLNNVTTIGGDLVIGNNDDLTSLIGLENIIAASIDNLYIYDNTSLSTCEVQSICDYLESPTGSISIQNNAPGCTSQEEVEEACWVSVEEMNVTENYSIYPNPVNDIATFSSEGIKSIEIYNMMGEIIIKRNANNVDMSNLPRGIYFVIGFDKDNYPLYKGKIIKK